MREGVRHPAQFGVAHGTNGAVLAENLSGPLRHRFGAARDLVLGVTLVLADGTIASAGGKVVKNVAGYDLARLVSYARAK